MKQWLDLVVVCMFVSLSWQQQVGTYTPENHPQLSVQSCVAGGTCETQQMAVVLDSNWRWVHSTTGYQNCYTGNQWDSSLCPDPVTCAANCALDGADYTGTYGVSTSGTSLRLNFVTGANVGSRVYLMQDQDNYKMFNLKNREFTFDVDVSNLPCGLNGALYLVEMLQDGGKGAYSGNKAGARYGTGYCDAQCPHDIKFINGQANTLNWTPSPNNSNTGTGYYGSCCFEMDIWEANSQANAVTPHTCTVTGQYRCSGTQCGDDSAGQRYSGVCDKDGCDFNPYRMGVHNFFGKGSSFSIDTSKPFTVVTQFITSNNLDSGTLSQINRLYVQNGAVYTTPPVSVTGIPPYTSISDNYCTDQKKTFGDPDQFATDGGMAAMGQALDRGMALVMSLWDDYTARMLWLDSDYPLTASPSQPGVARGPCDTSTGYPSQVESQSPNSYVTFSNIKYGAINSTFLGGVSPSPPPPPSSSPTPPPSSSTQYCCWYDSQSSPTSKCLCMSGGCPALTGYTLVYSFPSSNNCADCQQYCA